jgi:hypothetical protein
MNNHRIQCLSLITTIAIAVLLIGGAIVLKLTDADQYMTLWGLNTFFSSEYFHVPAHMLLYGTLTAGIYGLTRWRWPYVLLAVLTIGLVQEAAQSLLFDRAMGSGEVFDLGVNLFIASLVLVALHWAKRSFTPPSRLL